MSFNWLCFGNAFFPSCYFSLLRKTDVYPRQSLAKVVWRCPPGKPFHLDDTVSVSNLVPRVSLPLVVGTETLVAAGHVTICPSKTAGWVGTQVHLVERTIKYHPVAPPFQQIFLPPRFWVVTWPAATRVSVPTTKGGGEERPWEWGCECKLNLHHLALLNILFGFFSLLKLTQVEILLRS